MVAFGPAEFERSVPTGVVLSLRSRCRSDHDGRRPGEATEGLPVGDRCDQRPASACRSRRWSKEALRGLPDRRLRPGRSRISRCRTKTRRRGTARRSRFERSQPVWRYRPAASCGKTLLLSSIATSPSKYPPCHWPIASGGNRRINLVLTLVPREVALAVAGTRPLRRNAAERCKGKRWKDLGGTFQLGVIFLRLFGRFAREHIAFLQCHP